MTPQARGSVSRVRHGARGGRPRRARALVLVLMLAAAAAAQADGAALEVKLAGVRHVEGKLRVAVYADAGSFRKESEALVLGDVPAATGLRSVRFAGLAPGRYAIMAYHDENDDGRLNRLLGMIPREGWGLSNNPAVSGPPAFGDSAFDVVAGENVQIIELRY